MVVDRVEKYDCIYAFQRTLLPFFRGWKNLVRDTADRCIGDLQAIDIPDMLLDIRGRHTLRIHGNDFVLHIR